MSDTLQEKQALDAELHDVLLSTLSPKFAKLTPKEQEIIMIHSRELRERVWACKTQLTLSSKLV